MIYLIMDAIYDTYSTAAYQRPAQRAARDLRRLDAAQPAWDGAARWRRPALNVLSALGIGPRRGGERARSS